MNKRLSNKQIDNAIDKSIRALKALNKHGLNNSGWYKTKRSGPTGVGKTLRYLLHKSDSNKQTPELFNCITLKCHNEIRNKAITLFSQNPEKTDGRSTNSLIRQHYGYRDPKGSNNKVFHVKMFEDTQRCKHSNHYFKVERNASNVFILNNDPGQSPKIIAKWSKNNLNKAMKNKYKKLIIVNYSQKVINDTTYYRYDSVYIIKKVSIDDFFKSMDHHDKNTFIDVRLGVVRKGPNKNKKHDNGTGFRISLPDLLVHVQSNSIR